MAWMDIEYKALHFQFGALPLRFTTDLATVLIHDAGEKCSCPKESEDN